MKLHLMKWSLAMGVALMGAASLVRADGGDGGPLVDALVKKGLLNAQEGEEIRAEMLSDYTATPGGFLSVGSSAVKGLKLYGDVRLRYEWDKRAINTGMTGSSAGGVVNDIQERNRNRFRVRLGAEYLFSDNFKAGVRLATNGGGGDHNSTNADFGTGAKSWPANNTVFVDLAYLTWTKAFDQDWLSMTAGRQLQPHNIVNGWTWDSDINPDGGSIKIGDFHPFCKDFTIGSTHGIYVWGDQSTADNSYTSTSISGNALNTSSDPFLFVNQLDMAYKFSPSWNLRVSPAFVNGAGDSSVRTNNNVNPGWSDPAAFDINYLNVFMVDASLDTPFFLDNSKGRFYGEYGVNLTGQEMAAHYRNPDGANSVGQDGRNQFFLLGYQISGGGTKGKGKGGWALDGTYAYYETYSWTGALIDSDWNGGSLNGAGFGLKASYNFTENITGSVNWRHSGQIDNNVTDVTQVLPTAGVTKSDFSNTDLVQVDLIWKF
ncbi:MAG: putative porin [Methylacidiphilales bacterium]|nr:putative porin [Candidatus Methylacidiphilales bacterium]